MARTAPIPNIPAIPGMNPGVFVMGGGGAGGDGSGDGNGSGGDQGANGSGGGDAANGGGPNAGSCGPGSGGACPNPRHGNGGTAAGDPVDPCTGRVYTTAKTDLALPGTLPLFIRRSYSTSSLDVDMGLGPGWSHSLGWSIEERRRTVRVLAPDSAPVEIERLALGASIHLGCGRLTHHAWGYTLDAERLTRAFAIARDRRWLLTSIHDACGNAIRLTYIHGVLQHLVDSVGRVIRVRRGGNGRIAAFEVMDAPEHGRWISFRTYEYDAAGLLAAARDADGHAEEYQYDGDGRLIRRREPGGLVAEHRYARDGRCVETWCHRAGNDGLDASVPDLLSGGTTRARGFLHVKLDYGDGMTDVVTSRASRRIEGNHQHKPNKSVFAGGVHTYGYDPIGNLIRYTDAVGSTWTMRRNAAGQVVAETDPLGTFTELARDERGQIVEMCDGSGRSSRYEWDDRGRLLRISDALGMVAAFSYDARGLLVSAVLPNGGESRMVYDALGNRVQVTEPDGATRTIRYDYLGRVQAFTDARGDETSFTYDACSRLLSATSPGGAIEYYAYDTDGNRTQIVDADGRATTLRWGGSHVVTEIVRPDGQVVRYRYDREQDLVRIINELGDEHRLTRDGEGRVIEEHTFDGRTLSYRLDALGRLSRVREGDRLIEFTYDAIGRLVERSYSDDRKDLLEYDEVGRLVRLDNEDVVCELEYDARGRVCREISRCDGRTTKTEWTYDALGYPIRVVSPAATIEVRRDIVGRPLEMSYGDSGPIHFKYDALGHEVERVLPQGGRISRALTTSSRPARTSIHSSARRRSVGPGQPDWVGAVALGETWAKGYDWSPGGRLQRESLASGGVRELVRDADGRVIEYRASSGTSVRFGYTAAGDVLEPAAPRAYDPGGRVRARGNTTFEYDDRGRVVEKRVRASGGDRVATYTWSDDDRLMEVQLGDRVAVRFTYDALARRAQKRVIRGGALESVTRYAWQGDVLVQEIREAATSAGDPVVEERTFLSVPGSFLPIAHRVVSSGEASAVVHPVYEPNGAPAALVDGSGARVTPIDSGAFGAVITGGADTPFRLPGQYADEETGLHYNHHRYYDPETGCFLSPEPLGIMGSLKPYTYADFRLPEVIDPDGLVRGNIFGNPATPGAPNPRLATGTSGGDAQALHPAVAAALPPADANTGRTEDSRGRCAEPAAMSNHLFNWESQNPPRRCHPPDENWQGNLQSALGQVNQNGGIQSGSASGRNWPACENCSQMIPRLYTLAGMPPPGGVIAPGAAGAANNRPAFNPDPAFTSNAANAGYSGMPNPIYSSGAAPWPGGPESLGTWQHSDGFTPGATTPGSPGTGGGQWNQIR